MLYKSFSKKIRKEFDMFMFGEIKFFVGLQVHQMEDDIYIIQSKYIRQTLNVFGMEDSELVGILMSTRLKISNNDVSKEVNQTTYKSMIGKLQYVVHTRLDIALAVDIVVRFSINPKKNT